MQRVKRILILGGTAEARDIASALIEQGDDVTSSLAGVTRQPLLPVGAVRVGGFGGTAGLIDYLKATKIEVLVDATHPFAATISKHAHDAATALGILLLRFERLAWQPQPGDNWISVGSLIEAAKATPNDARVMITTGRKGLQPFLERNELSGIIRSIEPLAEILPSGWQLLLDRPPYDQANETELMLRHAITHLITKNAGGASTAQKLAVAHQLRVQVIMINRPSKPQCHSFATISQLISAVDS